jgi:hypothetical protein
MPRQANSFRLALPVSIIINNKYPIAMGDAKNAMGMLKILFCGSNPINTRERPAKKSNVFMHKRKNWYRLSANRQISFVL